ncbi:MAG TPA: molybdopterin-dependent oxidoreductase [Gaiellales bacterium]|jgi:anaerobic selenocysteine-containing dehydrogenase
MRTIVRGACPLDCPDTCSWLVEVEDGRAVDLRGDREQPYTHGALCPKVNRYLDAVNGDGRVTQPLRRVGPKGAGEFEQIGWDEALAATAAGLRAAIDRHGPESVLPYYFAGTEGMIQGWIMGPRLFAAMGASRLETTICTAAASAALKATYGSPVGMGPEDFEHSRLILLWGANLLSTNLHQWRYVLAAQKAGAHVVAIDPLRTDTASRCDEHVAPRPGTDAALALGLMRVVLDEGAEDREWLERHTDGWPELEARLAEWPVERAAAICGVPVERLVALGRRYAHTRPSAIRLGLGLQRHGGAGAAMRAILALPALTGDFRHVGGGLLSMTSGHFGGIRPGRVAIPDDLGAPPARTINMSRLGEALLVTDDPPVAALVVFDANPAASNPDLTRVQAGLAREDLFTVVLEQRLTDTALYADIVLPATMQPEHLDLHNSYGHHYVTLNVPAVTPPGTCLPNSEIFRRLAVSLGLDHPRLRESDEDVARDVLDCPAARAAGITFERLRDEGALRVAPEGAAPFAAGGFPTATGNIRLLAPELAESGNDPLIGYVPPHELEDEELAKRFPLALLSPASRFVLNSTFASLPWHRKRLGGPIVHLHPVDADARGIASGARVRVHNDRGAFNAEAVIDDAAQPGVAFTFKQQWPQLLAAGEHPNATIPERDADLGGSPTFHDNRVEISLAGESAAP